MMVKETETCSVIAVIKWLIYCFYLIPIALSYSNQTHVRRVTVQNPSIYIHNRMNTTNNCYNCLVEYFTILSVTNLCITEW
jgi:hypothetical protein